MKRRNGKAEIPARGSIQANIAATRIPAQTRGPKPSLSTDRIARAAIGLADAEGLSFSMQKLAQTVGLTTMALYRYFPGKAEVIALMIDSVAEAPPCFGSPSLPWVKRLKRWATCCLAIYTSHPWFLAATTARQTPMGPNELGWMEAALAILAEGGLNAKKQHHAFIAIIGHVRGYATFQQMKATGAAPVELARPLSQPSQIEADSYPALLSVFRSGAFSESTSAAFNFGLDCILYGIQAHLGSKG